MAEKTKIIRWNDRPQRQLKAILAYLVDNYSLTTAEKFLSKVESKLEQIQRYPESGQPTKYKSVRRLRFDKHHSIFYRMHGRKIFVVFIWDSRQHPNKNPYRKK